jgi:hypothetical protein
MPGNRIDLVPGTSSSFTIGLVDPTTARAIPSRRLANAVVKVIVATEPGGNAVLSFTSPDVNHIAVDQFRSTLTVNFSASDTSALTAGALYYWQVELDLQDGEIQQPIPWTPVSVTDGGSSAPTPPTFTNTASITADYPQANDMTYMSPGGSPIENAQIRVYLKSDYVCNRLTNPIGVTTTDCAGKWVSPILVTTGYTYVARFEKPHEWGPDTKEFFA